MFLSFAPVNEVNLACTTIERQNFPCALQNIHFNHLIFSNSQFYHCHWESIAVWSISQHWRSGAAWGFAVHWWYILNSKYVNQFSSFSNLKPLSITTYFRSNYHYEFSKIMAYFLVLFLGIKETKMFIRNR